MNSARSHPPDRQARGASTIASDVQARRALREGVATMASLLRPTLGPDAGKTAISGNVRNAAPELVSSAGIIARRTIATEGGFPNMGAMLLRQLVWQMHETVGDGGATVAVVAADLVNRALGYVEAGGDRVALSRGIEAAANTARQHLATSARSITHPREIAQVVSPIVGDAATALMIGEAIEQVGPTGALLVRKSTTGFDHCEYAAGAVWDGGALSTHLLDANRYAIDDPVVLVTDMEVDHDGCFAILQAALKVRAQSLVIVAPAISTEAVGLLVVNRDRGSIPGILAVKAPTSTNHDHRPVEDLALITGARFLSKIQGARLDRLLPGDFGSARQVWATRSAAGITGSAGDQEAIDLRIAQLERELATAMTDDARTTARRRIGRLAGVTVTIRAGGENDREVEARSVSLEAAVACGRAALESGVIAGGGIALLDAADAIGTMCLSGDELVGAKLLAHALEAPFRALAANAGHEPSPLVESRHPGVFDVTVGRWTDPWVAGILDPLRVQDQVIALGASFAATALRTDTLLVRSSPEVSIAP